MSSFVDRGGKYVWIANLDNLGASIDAALLGSFIEQGADVLVEVAPKVDGDKGGIPVHGPTSRTWARRKADAPRPPGARGSSALPPSFDANAVRVFNTNTFLVRAEPLLPPPTMRYAWFEVEKKVGGRVAVQFERLHPGADRRPACRRRCTRSVPREGVAASRFLPMNPDELARRRDDIRAVARRARGMILETP